MAKLYKILDSMSGVHLDAHVMGGYEFLMQNYEDGDKIFLFDTARALAGMINKIGLLPKDNHQQVPFAYKMYLREDEIGWKQSSAFKSSFAIDVEIEFIGVWDTIFRHALSLDEHRVRFQPKFFERLSPEEIDHGLKWGELPRSGKQHHRKALRDLERHYNKGRHFTDVQEVWFAGCHCDVGGGAVTNDVRKNLAGIPLRWMIRECFKAKTGILFDRESLKHIGMDPASLWPYVEKRPDAVRRFSVAAPPPVRKDTHPARENGMANNLTSEEEEDLPDALSDKNDMLKIAKSWWILELLPQKDSDFWVRRFSINLGRGRVVPKQHQEGVKIHRTVKLRMELKKENDKVYSPKAKLAPEIVPTWVE